MRKINFTLYTLLMLLVSVAAYAAPPQATAHLSNAMFIFIPSALAAIFVTYLVWRYNEAKRKQNPHRTVNRAPAKRPILPYHRKRSI